MDHEQALRIVTAPRILAMDENEPEALVVRGENIVRTGSSAEMTGSVHIER